MKQTYRFSIDAIRTRIPVSLKRYVKYALSQNRCFNFLYQRYLRDTIGLDESPQRIPKSITIETTNHCNANCSMCPRDQMKREKGYMDRTLYEKIIEDCVKNNVQEVRLHNFGEPLLHPQIISMIQFAKKHRLFASMFTNGSLLDVEKAQEIIESGLDELWVSIDSHQAEEYNTIRKGLDYHMLSSSLDSFIAAKKESGVRLPRLVLSHVLLNPHNRKAFLCAWKHRVDDILFVFYHDWSGKNTLQNEAKLLRRWPCPLLWKRMYVLWNGDAIVCCRDINGEVILGNLARESLAAIYCGERYRYFRTVHLQEAYERIPICKECRSLVFY